MGLVSAITDWLFGGQKAARKSGIFIPIPRAEYTMIPLSECSRSHDIKASGAATILANAGVDESTVFICGGYASYIAGLTNTYTDVDYFCTSRSTFNDICNELSRVERITDDIIKGEFENLVVNVIYNARAVNVEDFLDGFDISWSRVGIDFVEKCLVVHPFAPDENPVVDTNCIFHDLETISCQDLIKRVTDRFVKYRDRRVTKTRINIDHFKSVTSIQIQHINRQKHEIVINPATKVVIGNAYQVNSQQIARTSY